MELHIGITDRQNSKRKSVFLDRGILKESCGINTVKKILGFSLSLALSSHHFVPKAVAITQKCMAAAQEIKTSKEMLPFWPNDQKRGASEVHRVWEESWKGKSWRRESLKSVYKPLSCVCVGHTQSS